MSSQSSRNATNDIIKLLLRAGTRLNNDERFDTAKPVFARALEIALALHGLDHEETHECLNAVALCDYNRGDYACALASYERLLGCMRRRWGCDDDLYKITLDNVQRCRQLVGGARTMNVAEIVFRSYFPDEIEYARFKAEHAVRVSSGERLDPEGSFVAVGDPVPEYPMSVEHMPGGVLRGEAPKAWTIETTWIMKDGKRVYERRYVDGSVSREVESEEQ